MGKAVRTFKVTFTQVSHHRVGAIVTAKNVQEAITKARAGECTDEFDLTHPESEELINFKAESIQPEAATKWLEDQRARQKE